MATKTTKTTKSAKKPTTSAKKTATVKTVKAVQPARVAPAKKPTKVISEKPAKVQSVAPSRTETSATKNRSFRVRKSVIIPVLGVLLIGLLLYYFRSAFVAATVNGQPISRLSVVKELEQQGGKQALNSLVTKTLIEQESSKQNVTVNQDEINQEIKKIEDNLKQQGQQLDQVLAIQGMSKDQLIEQIRLQKAVEKMIGKDIKVSDQEIDEYIESNKDSLPQDQKPEDLRKDVSERLRQGKLNDKVQTWLQELQKNAKINYFVTY